MTQLQEIDKQNLILNLHAVGNDPYRIAVAVREDIVYVKRVIKQHQHHKTFSEPEDKEIADAMRTLAWRALDEALDIYQYGHPTEKYGLTKTILARVSGLVGQQTTTRYEDMRNELEEILGAQRGTDAPLEEPVIETEPQLDAPGWDTYDPDEGTHD